MRTSISKTITVLMLFVTLSVNNFSDANGLLGVWTQVANFGGSARQYAVGFSIDSLGYLGLGSDSAGLPKDFWKYSPATNSWSMIDSIFNYATGEYISRTSAISFSYDSAGFVGMGRDSSDFNSDLWYYNPASNTWTDATASSTVLPVIRTLAVAFAIDSTGYVATGVGESSTYFNDIYQYNMPTQTFATINPGNNIPNGRAAGIGFAINGYGYMGLGLDDSTYYNDLWQYNPINDSWEQVADFPGTPRFGAVAFTICGYGYVGLGEDLNSTYRQDFWRYDPTNNSWTFVNHFPGTGRRSAIAFVVNNTAYVGTGWDGNGRTNDMYSFICDSTTGFNPITQNNASVTIFPNPNNGNFEINYDLNGSSNALLSLTDVTGRIVATYQLSSSKNNLMIAQSALNNGIYFYSIKTDDKTISFGKFSVIK